MTVSSTSGHKMMTGPSASSKDDDDDDVLEAKLPDMQSQRWRLFVETSPGFVRVFSLAPVLFSLVGPLLNSPAPQKIVGPFVLLSFSLWICRWWADERLQAQREWLTTFRKACSEKLDLARLRDVGPEDWVTNDGSMYAMRALTIVMVGFQLSFISEGKWVAALALVPPMCAFFIAGMYGSPELRNDTMRLNVLSQFAATFMLGATYTEETARRAVIIRTVASISAIEALDELFLHIVGMMTLLFYLMFGPDSTVLLLPIRTFAFFVLPVDMLGLRPLLAKWVHQRSARKGASNPVATVTTIIPVFLVFLSFGRSIKDPLSLFNVVAALCFLLGIACKRFQEQVDFAIHPNWKSSTDVSLISVRYLFLVVGAICIMHRYYFYGVLMSLAFLVATILQNDERSRQALLLCYAILFLQADVHQNELLMVMLSSSRLTLAFEHRPFSAIALESLLMAALQIFVSPGPVQGTVALLCVSGVAVAVATALMQENAFQLLNIVKNADSFLDHALKQKFSSVGAAIAQVLETSAADFDSLQYQSLVKALQECRVGQNSCYLSSYAIQYQAGALLGESASNKQTKDLVEMMMTWSGEGVLSHCRLSFDSPSVPIELTVDWELLKVLLSDMTKKLDNDCSLMINVVRTPRTIQIRFEYEAATLALGRVNKLRTRESELKQSFILGVRKTVAAALGAVLDDSVLEFAMYSSPLTSPLAFGARLARRASPLVPVATASGSPPTMIKFPKAPSTSSSSSRLTDRQSKASSHDIRGHLLPTGLTFAVLDDSNLVRKSLMHMFKHHLKASPSSFATGATVEEATFFPHEICLKHVHIAIFDENLDYGYDRMIKGTTLAVQARQRGFDKCAILHSANVELGRNLDPAFNGFVEKTASREDFLRNIAKVWDDFLRSSPPFAMGNQQHVY